LEKFSTIHGLCASVEIALPSNRCVPNRELGTVTQWYLICRGIDFNVKPLAISGYMNVLRVISIITSILLITCNAVGQRDQAWQLGPWTRLSEEPVIRPSAATFTDPLTSQTVSWEKLHTFNPAAIVRNGKICVLYRAEDDTGKMGLGNHTSRIGLAESTDGIHFTRLPEPVFFPAIDDQRPREEEGGTEDPRIVQTADGRYVMTYTQWSRIAKTYTTGVATSPDLRTWTKYGPIFAGAGNGKYNLLAYKSAGIVTQLEGGRIVAAKIHGRYWMYWGEIEIRLATSTDLIHWTPVEGPDGQPIVLMSARAGKFDSAFPEMGPPPLLTKRGILVIYNARNADKYKMGPGNTPGNPNLAPGAYAVGEALFDAAHPERLISRTEEPVFSPTLPWESNGQYRPGTTFAEGLVRFKHKWLLYYGASDSFVGVASADAKER
jgi:beta-1,2-mannosidase